MLTARLRIATAADLPWIEHLSRKLSNALGFVPRAAVCDHIGRNNYLMLDLNGQAAAFSLLSGGSRRPTRIIQHAVTDELWRSGYGTVLLAAVAQRALLAKRPGITLSCRDGLIANDFWTATGAERVGTLHPLTARRRSIHAYHYGQRAIVELARFVHALRVPGDDFTLTSCVAIE